MLTVGVTNRVVAYVVGLVWTVLLASDQFNAGTYLSENALLPGQVKHSGIGGLDKLLVISFDILVQNAGKISKLITQNMSNPPVLVALPLPS